MRCRAEQDDQQPENSQEQVSKCTDRHSTPAALCAVGSRTHRRSIEQKHVNFPSGLSYLQASSSNTTQQKEEEPIWVRRERERELQKQQGSDLPFGVYLLASAIVAIAAVGSIFEFVNKNPIFDVIEADSPLYTPILGIFALTGLPTSGYLFYKAVSTANKEAERMDKLDGY
jgi:hypothetical protein